MGLVTGVDIFHQPADVRLHCTASEGGCKVVPQQVIESGFFTSTVYGSFLLEYRQQGLKLCDCGVFANRIASPNLIERRRLSHDQWCSVHQADLMAMVLDGIASEDICKRVVSHKRR